MSMFPTMPMFPMGFMPMMPMPGPVMPATMGAMPRWMVPSDDVQQEVNKAYLVTHKQQLTQAIQSLDEYRKLLEEQLATIDKQFAKLSEADQEQRKPTRAPK